MKRTFVPKIATNEDKKVLTDIIEALTRTAHAMADVVNLDATKEQGNIPGMAGFVVLNDSMLGGFARHLALFAIENDRSKQLLMERVCSINAERPSIATALALPSYVRQGSDKESALNAVPIETIFIYAETVTGACAMTRMIVSRDDDKYALSPAEDIHFGAEKDMQISELVGFYQ